jgi:hypothetical protein
LRTGGRENGDMEAAAPYSGVLHNLQLRETRILIRLLWKYFPQNWEFMNSEPAHCFFFKLMYFVKKQAGCTAKFLEILTVYMFKENHLNA